MSICVDCRLINAAGIGTYLKTSLKALAEQKKYHLMLLANSSDFSFLKQYSKHLISMCSNVYTIREQFEYLNKIPRCDLFWAPHFNIPFFPIRAEKRMTTIHDVYHLAHWKSLPILQKIYAKITYNAAFLFSDQIITVSEFSKREILKYALLKPKHLTVIHNRLDFVAIKRERSQEDFILAVGSLKNHKNLFRLVKAYALIQPKERLYIVGKKEGLLSMDKKLMYEVENDPYLKSHVLFMGYVTDQKLKELYATAKLFLFPSTYEGFGYPPLEAMASGCPVVAARIAAIPEVCQEAVEYIDPHSVQSIAEGMERILNDVQRREELIQKGDALVVRKRAEENTILNVIDLLCR